jgi:hypothetical protein
MKSKIVQRPVAGFASRAVILSFVAIDRGRGVSASAVARGLTMLFQIIFFSVRLDVGTVMV